MIWCISSEPPNLSSSSFLSAFPSPLFTTFYYYLTMYPILSIYLMVISIVCMLQLVQFIYCSHHHHSKAFTYARIVRKSAECFGAFQVSSQIHPYYLPFSAFSLPLPLFTSDYYSLPIYPIRSIYLIIAVLSIYLINYLSIQSWRSLHARIARASDECYGAFQVSPQIHPHHLSFYAIPIPLYITYLLLPTYLPYHTFLSTLSYPHSLSIWYMFLFIYSQLYIYSLFLSM